MDATKAKSFLQLVSDGGEKFERQGITTMQINIGKLCNQACLHCHVEAGPNKTRENMHLLLCQKLSCGLLPLFKENGQITPVYNL